MPALFSIFLGGAFTVASAYAWGALALRRLPVPWEIALAAGAAIESLLVFVVLACSAGGWPAYLGLGAAPLAALVWSRRSRLSSFPVAGGLGAGWPSLLPALPFLAYAAWYLVNALAPETWPDGITYHLGLPAEYVRIGAFPGRITFFDMVPAGHGNALHHGVCFRTPFGRETGGVRSVCRHASADPPYRLALGIEPRRRAPRRGSLFFRSRGRAHRIVVLQRCRTGVFRAGVLLASARVAGPGARRRRRLLVGRGPDGGLLLCRQDAGSSRRVGCGPIRDRPAALARPVAVGCGSRTRPWRHGWPAPPS